MIKKRPFIPNNEIKRWYGREGDLNPNNVILPCDGEEDENKA